MDEQRENAIDRRKGQLAQANKRSKFKKMVIVREAKGKRHSLPVGDLVELFMNQTEGQRVAGIEFLKRFTLRADDIQFPEDDIRSSCTDDIQFSGDDIRSADEVEIQSATQGYQGIPSETTQSELVGLLVKFFKDKALAPDHVRRTLNRAAESYAVQLYPDATVEDLPKVITEALRCGAPSMNDIAQAILEGLQKAQYSETSILSVVESMISSINNHPKRA